MHQFGYLYIGQIMSVTFDLAPPPSYFRIVIIEKIMMIEIIMIITIMIITIIIILIIIVGIIVVIKIIRQTIVML